MDLSPHFQPYSNAEAEQAGVKTDMKICGGVHLIFQRGFPFQPCSSHFGRDFPLLSWPASSGVLFNKSGFALQSHKCSHLQQYLGIAETSTWSEGLLVQLKGSSSTGQSSHFGEETGHLWEPLYWPRSWGRLHHRDEVWLDGITIGCCISPNSCWIHQ